LGIPDDVKDPQIVLLKRQIFQGVMLDLAKSLGEHEPFLH
jgi:hypothetical protein